MNEDGQSCDIIGKYIFLLINFPFNIIVFSVKMPNFEKIRAINSNFLLFNIFIF